MKAKSKVLAGVALLAVGSTAAYAATVTVGVDPTDVATSTGVNSATYSGVQVTATVQPTLTMNISTGGLSLGDLNTSTLTEQSLNIEVGTNAKNGATVTATSANGGLASTTASHTLTTQTAGEFTGEQYQFTATPGTQDVIVGGAVPTGLVATDITSANKTQTIYTADRPQKADATPDLSFKIGAKSSDVTPAAADYSDTITLTVTGSY